MTLPTVMICTPTHDGSVATSYMVSLLRTLLKVPETGPYATFLTAPHVYEDDIVRVRSAYVADFLASPADFLLLIDHDHDWDPRCVEQMVRYALKGEDFIATRYRRKTYDDSIQYVVGGVGFTMLSRKMLEKMVAHYQDLWFTHDGRTPETRRTVIALFLPFFEKTYTTVEGLQARNLWSEDYAFRERWLAIGGTFADIDPPPGTVGHWGIQRFTKPPTKLLGPLHKGQPPAGATNAAIRTAQENGSTTVDVSAMAAGTLRWRSDYGKPSTLPAPAVSDAGETSADDEARELLAIAEANGNG